MKKVLSVFIFLFLLVSLAGYTQTKGANFQQAPTEIRPLMVAQGFAFENKEFKVLKVAISGEVAATRGKTREKGPEKFQNIKGFIEIGGFQFELKLVSRDEKMIEADLIEPSKDFLPSNETLSEDSARELDIPVGHLSIKASRPDPKNVVFLGSLRVTSETAEDANGTYEVYLNDNTPIFAQKNIDKAKPKKLE
jgi:hypothetical protein